MVYLKSLGYPPVLIILKSVLTNSLILAEPPGEKDGPLETAGRLIYHAKMFSAVHQYFSAILTTITKWGIATVSQTVEKCIISKASDFSWKNGKGLARERPKLFPGGPFGYLKYRQADQKLPGHRAFRPVQEKEAVQQKEGQGEPSDDGAPERKTFMVALRSWKEWEFTELPPGDHSELQPFALMGNLYPAFAAVPT